MMNFSSAIVGYSSVRNPRKGRLPYRGELAAFGPTFPGNGRVLSFRGHGLSTVERFTCTVVRYISGFETGSL